MSNLRKLSRNQFSHIISPTGQSMKSSDGREIYQINEEKEEYENYNSLDQLAIIKNVQGEVDKPLPLFQISK